MTAEFNPLSASVAHINWFLYKAILSLNGLRPYQRSMMELLSGNS